ncbi:PD-(D/E)XK motif protein [Ruegeria sp. HKCCA4008]|uniref:PD-(D/E)XK motif protein n=1 Tax=Ruegeria sp. HKCCA4008 TaxID=2682999 RepID=UPI001489F09F|nr:PD-(D/E)XK motif protein [Ruegeria sp. HKCCA4008]
MSDPWSDIARPDHPGYNSEMRADPKHPLAFFRGRDFYGRYVFSIEGQVSVDDVPTLPEFSEIDVGVVRTGQADCRLSLTLKDPDQKDVFGALCRNLLDATRQLGDGESGRGIIIVANRLIRWFELLRRRRDKLLSRNQIIGLVGELLFLRDYALERLHPVDAVNSWRGPYGDEQDFVVGTQIVEVKTQLSTADKRLKISSAEQLDTRSCSITVVHQIVSPADSAGSPKCTLNELVAEIAQVLGTRSPEAVDLFGAALVEAGWIERPEYDETAWSSVGRSFYDIRPGFPRITPEKLPQGVTGVSYAVEVAACGPFELGHEEALGKIYDGTE